MSVLSATAPGAKPGTQPETCPKCNGKGQVVYTQQSMFGMVQNVQTCPDCGGTGKIIKEKCPACRGTGYTSSRKRIAVSIPAGIDNGPERADPRKGRAWRQWRRAGRSAGGSGCFSVILPSNARIPIFILRCPISFANGGPGRRDPNQDCGRRSGLQCSAWNPDRYQDPAEGQRVFRYLRSKNIRRRPLCNSGSQGTGKTQ